MITVMNRLRQPLVFNVVTEKEGDPASIYFLAKETKEITTIQFNSPEIKSAINRGDILVLKMD